MLQRPGSSWGFGALLKDTSVVVLKEERALVIHSPTNNPCRTWDSNTQPLDYESDSLTIRPRLPPNIALYCVLLYTQSTLQSCGGSLLNHHQCAASTWMMRRQPQNNGASALTTHQLRRGEKREIEPIKWMGIIRRPWLTRASGGNLARTPGLHPYSLRWVSWDF